MNVCFFSLHQWTPLHIAARRGHKDIVKHLVDNKATLNIQDNEKVNLTEPWAV